MSVGSYNLVPNPVAPKVVLLSGGMDSAVLLAWLNAELKHRDAVSAPSSKIHTVSVIYGQRHSIQELECAKWMAKYYEVPWTLIDLSTVYQSCSNPLIGRAQEMTKGSYAEQQKESENGVVKTYIPFRNGLLLSAVAAYGLSIGADQVFYGAHLDDSAGNAYPDCSQQFVDKMNAAIEEGTAGQISLCAPFVTLGLDKTNLVSLGHAMYVPFERTWSCYEGGEEACGVCGTCIDRLKAFEACNLKDPLKYKKQD